MMARLTDRQRAGLALTTLGIGAALAARAMRGRRYSFQGKTVIVTGGSRGLGFELARQLASEGARPWLVARTAQAVEEAAEELRRAGADVRAISADVRRLDDVRRVVSTVAAEAGGIDVLVNNAGIIEVSPFEQTTMGDFEDSLATHFWGPLGLIREALPYLKASPGARVVNISSIGGVIGVPHLSAYAAGKFALTGLSETLRAELAKYGIVVTTVTPGLMRTGSYVNVDVRGDHRREMQWFTAMSATPLTSMRTRRAARQILDAVRAGRAAVTPGWQARVARVAAHVAPNSTAAVSATVDSQVLPSPAGAGGSAHAADVDPGPVKVLLPAGTRREFHQPEPRWARTTP